MKREYNKIFWRAGQEITPETFIQADNYICYQQNLIRKIMSRGFYGLLPIDDNEKQEFSVKAELDDLKIRIEQLCCRGITKDGFLIEIDDKLRPLPVKNSLSMPDCSSGKYYVVVRINPYKQVLIESVENEETPFSQPAYELDIKKLNQLIENELPILKIDFDCNFPQIDRNYIPPCTSILSHKKIFEYYLAYKQILNEILSLIRIKKEQYGQLIFPVSMHILDIEHFSLSESPNSLIQLIRKILKIFGFFIPNLQPGIEKYIIMPYNHNDTEGLFKSFYTCLDEILSLVGKEEEKVIEEDFTPKI